MERVRQRLRVAGEHLDRVREQRRLATARAARVTADADHVSEEHVDLSRLRRLADHLDPTRPVDDVEEDELAHVAPRHRAARDPAGRGSRLARLERLALVPHRGDLGPVGEALGGFRAGAVIGSEPDDRLKPDTLHRPQAATPP